MRAINLIPADARAGGGSGAAGRSGGAAYALLGGLAVLVALTVVWAMTSSAVADKRAELAQVQQDVAQVRARAGGNAAPGAVQQLRVARTAIVRSLAQQRLDWAATLDALSRTLPADTTLTGLDGSTTGAAAGTAPAPAGAPATGGPTVQLDGCAPSQRAVALLMPRLRTMPGVTGVQLQSSTLADPSAGAASPAATGSTTCPRAAFVMVLTLTGPAAPPATAAAPATTAPAAATAPATTPPAATTAVPGTPTPGAGSGQ